MIFPTIDGGRVYYCDICRKCFGYCGPGEKENFDDMIMIKGDGIFFDSHVHSKCFGSVMIKVEAVAERRKNERKRT